MKARSVAMFAGIAGVTLVVLAKRRRRERCSETMRLEAAPTIVVRATRAALRVRAREIGDVEVTVDGRLRPADVVTAERPEGGDRLILDAGDGATLDVAVPHGTAVCLEVSRSSANVAGIDNVDIRCERSAVSLKDVGGEIAVHSKRAAIRIHLAREREIKAVGLHAKRSALALDVPPSLRASYDIQSDRSTVSHPASTTGGVPVSIDAKRASVRVRAA